MQVLDKGSVSGSPYTAVVGSDSWAIALTAEELQSFVQARNAAVVAREDERACRPSWRADRMFLMCVSVLMVSCPPSEV